MSITDDIYENNLIYLLMIVMRKKQIVNIPKMVFKTPVVTKNIVIITLMIYHESN